MPMLPYQFILGDALKTGLSDKSVDLVFGSPPYEDRRTYGIGFALKGQAWVDWMVAGFREWLRVSRGMVAMVVEGYTDDFWWSATPALLLADLHRAGITLRKPPIFHRVGIPGSGGPDYLRNDWEWIICATNGGKLPWSDNTAMGHPPKYAPGGEMSNRLSDGSRRNQWGGTGNSTGMQGRKANGVHKKNGRPSHTTLHTKADGTTVLREARQVITRERDGMNDQSQVGYTIPVKANPGNVIKCNVGGGVMGHKLSHENEAPFPETLANFFIRSFCPPNGTTLDPFSGSGTTPAAAIKAGRKAIGIDKRFSQVKLGTRRCQEVWATMQGVKA